MVTCIVNPSSAGGRTASMIPSIREGLGSRYTEFIEWHITTRPGDAREFVSRSVDRSRLRTIIVIGGDGTLQEVANGWMDLPVDLRHGVRFGLVSSGTGQGLAQGLALPHDLRAQFDLITSGQVRKLDLGRVVHSSPDGTDRVRYFVNECQFGIGGAVVRDVEHRGKTRSGRWTFAAAAFRQALTIRNRPLDITCDHDPIGTNLSIGLVIGNGPFTGGGMHLTPGASPFDGMLDLLIMAAQTVPQRIANLRRIYSASHVGRREFSIRRFAHAEVRSSEPIEVEADGEFLGTTPCRISLVPGIFPLIVPAEAL